MVRRGLLIIFATMWVANAQPARAQNVYYSTPLVSVTDSFYEWYGIDWNYRWRGPNSNFFFHRGGSQATIPPFGGFNPATAGRLGFSTQGANHAFSFGLTAAQGSHRTITSSTPSVTVSNGAIGSVRDVQMRPFVTGLIPVVGSGSGYRAPPPTLISPLKQRLARLNEESSRPAPRPTAEDDVIAPKDAPKDAPVAADLVLGPGTPSPELSLGTSSGSSARTASTAERGDISVAEIRQRREARSREAAEALGRLIEEARSAEAVGRFGAARVRYRQAAARADGEQRTALLEKLESLRDR